MLIFGVLLIIGSALYLFYLNRKEEESVPTPDPTPTLPSGPSARPPLDKPQTSAMSRGAGLGIVFLANLCIFALQIFIPTYSLGFFWIAIGFNIIAAVFCFLTGRPHLVRTFLLCLLWVCLIGPAILAALCFAVVGTSSLIGSCNH